MTMARVERLLVITTALLIVIGAGIYFGVATLSADHGFELQNPEIWSSRFPESTLVHRAIQREMKRGTNCEVSAEAGSDALPPPITDYGALVPNDPGVMIALARFARKCGQGRHAIPLIRRALALGRSDINLFLESYRFRRFLGYRDPTLADALDRKLVYLWQRQPQFRREIAKLIEECWSCSILLKSSAPDVHKQVEAFGKR